MESTWSKETFYINRITNNTVGPEILMGRWDTLYEKTESKADCVFPLSQESQRAATFRTDQ
jgi:hypothetical protein